MLVISELSKLGLHKKEKKHIKEAHWHLMEKQKET